MKLCARHGAYSGRGGCPECRKIRAARPKPRTDLDRIRSTSRWQEARRKCVELAGGRCTYGLEEGDRGAQAYPGGRCPVTEKLDAHHRVALEDGGAPYAQDNLRCVCRGHHSRLEAERRRAR